MLGLRSTCEKQERPHVRCDSILFGSRKSGSLAGPRCLQPAGKLRWASELLQMTLSKVTCRVVSTLGWSRKAVENVKVVTLSPHPVLQAGLPQQRGALPIPGERPLTAMTTAEARRALDRTLRASIIIRHHCLQGTYNLVQG